MANEILVRPNFCSGTITNNPLASGGTTLNSAELANLPAIGATQFVKIVLNPLGDVAYSVGPEIVYVTAHTASQTSATIARGKEGTTGIQHATGCPWVCGPVASDWTLVGNTADRPSGTGLPYDGEVFSNVETDSLDIYNQGNTAWQQIGPLSGWTTWTPTVTQSATPAQTVLDARYMRIGRTILGTAQINFSGAGTGSNTIVCTLPVTARTPAGVPILGTFQYFDSGATQHQGSAMYASTTTCNFSYDGFGSVMGQGDLAIASGDALRVSFQYEAAA